MSRKKILMTAAVFAVLLIAILLVIRLSSPKSIPQDSGDTESLYSYTFLSDKNGLTVTISGGKDGWNWKAASDDLTVLYPQTPKSGEGKCSFLLKPMIDGSTRVTFSLERPGSFGECSYQIYTDAAVSDGTVTVTGCGHRAFDDALEGEDGRYSVIQQNDGWYFVSMLTGDGTNWQFRSEGGSVDGGPYTLDDVTETADEDGTETEDGESALDDFLIHPSFFHFRCIGNEPATIYIYDREAGEALQIRMEYEENNGMFLFSHEMASYQYVQPDFPEQQGDDTEKDPQTPYEEEFPELAGLRLEPPTRDWTLPDGAEYITSGCSRWSLGDRAASEKTDCVVFRMDGVLWTLWSFRTLPAETLTGTDAAEVSAAVENEGMWIGKNGNNPIAGGVFAVWNGREDTVYMLHAFSGTEDAEPVRKTASALSDM